MLLLLLACAPTSDPTLLLDPDETRGGQPGELGPFGVGRSQYRATRATSRSFPVDLHFPADSDGWMAEGEHPVVLWVQGGAVERERYHWIGEHLASRGYVVLTPQFPNDLAIFGSNRAHEALQRARNLDQDGDPLLAGALSPEPAGIAGHSLGGVVAAKQWARHPGDFEALILVASYPTGGDDVEDRGGTPVLSITGALDGSAALEDVEEGAQRFQDGTLAIVDGMNHYDWTDDVTEAEQEKEDSPHDRPAEESRADAWRVLDSYLDAAMLGDTGAWEAAEFPGVTLE